MIEYEMKFKVKHSVIQPKLEMLEGEKISKDFNHDYYFNHPVRDFRETDEALRIRIDSNGTKVTYKGPKFDNRSKTREEIDLDVENDNIGIIFEKLGFVKSGIVKKERIKYKINEFTITLDKVENLGEFIEIELVKETNEDMDRIIAQMIQFLDNLNLDKDDQILESYLELVEKNNGSKNNQVSD